MSLTIERRGNLALVQNQHYQIDFDLSKGTWNYYDSDGYRIIRNAYTNIILNNGTNLTTVDAKFREFTTQPPGKDQFGRYQQIIFSYEPQSRKFRTNIYLKCYHDEPYLVFDVGVENLGSKQIRLSQIALISVSPLAVLTQKSGKYRCHLPSIGLLYGIMISSLDQRKTSGCRSRYFMNFNSHPDRYRISLVSPLYLSLF